MFDWRAPCVVVARLDGLGKAGPFPARSAAAFWMEVNDQGLAVNGICELEAEGAFARFSVPGNAVVEHLTDDDIY